MSLGAVLCNSATLHLRITSCTVVPCTESVLQPSLCCLLGDSRLKAAFLCQPFVQHSFTHSQRKTSSGLHWAWPNCKPRPPLHPIGAPLERRNPGTPAKELGLLGQCGTPRELSAFPSTLRHSSPPTTGRLSNLLRFLCLLCCTVPVVDIIVAPSSA